MPFSLPTITAITEVVTGGSGFATPGVRIGVYRTGPQLEMFFGAVNLHLKIRLSRVPSVRSLLIDTNNDPDGFDKIKSVIEAVVDPREFPTDGEEMAARVIGHLNRTLRMDGFELRPVDDRHRLISIATNSAATTALREHAASLELDSVLRDFNRALDRAANDPEGAITAACSTIESVCKCLLDEMGQPYPASEDIRGLVREVQRHLNLSPGRPDLDPDVRHILSGLSSITGGIGALRTHAGDAHGRGADSATVTPALARLAIHSASAAAVFFIETWQGRVR